MGSKAQGGEVVTSDILVSHPHVGSVWLLDAWEHDGQVSGKVLADYMFGHALYEVLTFPATCIRRRGKP